MKSEDNKPEDESRRNFLKLMGVITVGAASVGALRGVIQNIIPPPSKTITSFPVLTLVGSSGSPIKTTDLKVNDLSIVTFLYPLQGEPNFLLRLGNSSNKDIAIPSMTVKIPINGSTYKSPGGTGPYNSVVASSAICQHLGCEPPAIHFYPPSSSSYSGKIHCSCHGSTYDPFSGFSVVNGPTQRPLPSVIMSYDKASDTYSVKNMVGPTIYGKPSDLSGAASLPSSTQTTVTNSGVPP
ncbi:MAG: Rieske 2Fe-2S domain-containing protein [Thermoplasmatales archaeon]|nr:Rieske 2Fe-2S domain-containing protein [Thermoplasmatales archaeon]MCW6170060.1 Rieske 2Fe-2S domain-containing protein [Thermoplasmatales archaeon]